jgi:hypothetical protein
MSHIFGVVPAKAGTHNPCAYCFLRTWPETWPEKTWPEKLLSLIVLVLLRSMGPRVRGDDLFGGASA